MPIWITACTCNPLSRPVSEPVFQITQEATFMTFEVPVPQLETDRLILRGHRLEDFSGCAAMWSDPAVTAYISGSPSTEEQSWFRLLRCRGHWSFLGYGTWLVERRSDGEFLGEVGLVDYRRPETSQQAAIPEAGWVFKTAAQGKGYATEAVTAMLRWADEYLERPQTLCLTDPEHSASIRVARKVGYTDERLGLDRERKTLFMTRKRRKT